MKRRMEINGLAVEANYSDETVGTIFLPLLAGLGKMRGNAGGGSSCFSRRPRQRGRALW